MIAAPQFPVAGLTLDNNLVSEVTNTCIPSNLESITVDTHHEKLTKYLQASLSANSKRAYRSDLLQFESWGGTIPTTPQVVAQYLVAHAETLSNATLSRRLVSISRAHTSHGYESPTQNDLVKATLHGIRRVHGTAQRQVSPIMKADITAMVENLSGIIGARDKALLLTGFAGAFRRSELVALQCSDIEWVELGMVVNLRSSKTDQLGHGRKVGIPFARGRHCAVKSLKQWLEIANITGGFLFRSVTKHGKISEARLSPEAVATIVKKHAQAIGLSSEKFSGHSLRTGLVSSAAQAGVPSNKIRQQTGHTSDAMLARYIRDAGIFIDNAAGAVL